MSSPGKRKGSNAEEEADTDQDKVIESKRRNLFAEKTMETIMEEESIISNLDSTDTTSAKKSHNCQSEILETEVGREDANNSEEINPKTSNGIILLSQNAKKNEEMIVVDTRDTNCPAQKEVDIVREASDDIFESRTLPKTKHKLIIEETSSDESDSELSTNRTSPIPKSLPSRESSVVSTKSTRSTRSSRSSRSGSSNQEISTENDDIDKVTPTSGSNPPSSPKDKKEKTLRT